MKGESLLTLEEKIELRQLNQKCMRLETRIRELEAKWQIEFVTPKELSMILGCSLNNIYIKIRQGKIKAVHIGRSCRIPMNQFQKQEQSSAIKQKVFHVI